MMDIYFDERVPTIHVLKMKTCTYFWQYILIIPKIAWSDGVKSLLLHHKFLNPHDHLYVEIKNALKLSDSVDYFTGIISPMTYAHNNYDFEYSIGMSENLIQYLDDCLENLVNSVEPGINVIRHKDDFSFSIKYFQRLQIRHAAL